jgi:hypothetical protein
LGKTKDYFKITIITSTNSEKKGDAHMSWQEYSKIIQEDYHIECDDTVTKVPFENIIDVTEKDIIFKNNDGEIQNISLEECAKNFYSAFGVTEEEYSSRECKGIGGRYSARSNGFYELFTDNHHIRFCRTTKTTPFKNFLMRIGWNAYSKDDSHFWSLEKRLRAIGYSTMDLT